MNCETFVFTFHKSICNAGRQLISETANRHLATSLKKFSAEIRRVEKTALLELRCALEPDSRLKGFDKQFRAKCSAFGRLECSFFSVCSHAWRDGKIIN